MSTIATPLERARESASITRWWVLAGAIIVQLILGTVYGYSIFWQPLQAAVFPTVITQVERAELVAAGQDVSAMAVVPDAASAARERQKQQGHLKYIFSICILSFAVVMVIAGRIQDVTGPRLPAIIGATLMGAGFLLAGLIGHPIVFYLSHAAFTGAVAIVLLMLSHAVFARVDPEESPIVQYVPYGIVAAVVTAGVVLGNQYVGKTGELDRLLLLWGTVGFLAGAGIGFAYVCPIAALVKWFPEQKGLVSGLAVAGFGFGAYLFKGRSALGALGYIEGHGITSFFLIHGLICFVAITLGALLLRNPPDTLAATPGDTHWQETLRRPAFYILWVMFFSGAMAGLMVIGIVKVFAGEQLVAAAAADLGVVAKRDLLAKGAEAVGWLAIF
jgi:OFA family oxalate/formate antiporter-like MFS transporter